MSSIIQRGRRKSAISPRFRRRLAAQRIDVLLNGCPVESGVLPQLVGNTDRIDADRRPPRRLIPVPVNLTMVGAAERHGVLVADLAAQRPRLREAQVMRLTGLPLTSKARLRGHESEMGAMAVAAWLAQGKGALVDAPVNGIVHRRCLDPR
jgi:hypothetical protein